MGLVKCNKHESGYGFLCEVCEHIYEDIGRRIKPDSYYSLPDLIVCQKCYDQIPHKDMEYDKLLDLLLELPEEDTDVLEQKYLENYNSVKRYVYCRDCFNELTNKRS